jgi:DNA-binding PadR family transcriptional regulator
MVRASGSLRPPSYFILAALLDGPLHGYGIIKQAAKLSDGQVRLTAGTLYGALDRLAEEGLILADGQEVVEGRTRRYYRLTDHGVQALHREAARMEQAARVVTRRSGSAATTPRLA